MAADPRVQLGENIRRLRRKKGISQEELGHISNLDRTYISGIERGQRNVSLLSIVEIARALNVTVTRLLRGI